MKNATFIALILLSATSFLYCEPTTTDFSKLASPPDNAIAGEMHDGIQIGLWTEKPVYQNNELRNIWIFARKNGDSNVTIGVGGSLFEDSYLYIYHNDKEVRKSPIDGGIDGMVNPSYFARGISGFFDDLSEGNYKLVWKTNKFESNAITIAIK